MNRYYIFFWLLVLPASSTIASSLALIEKAGALATIPLASLKLKHATSFNKAIYLPEYLRKRIVKL